MKSKTNTALLKLRSHCDLVNDRLQTDFISFKDLMINQFDLEQGELLYKRICDNSQTKSILSEVTEDISNCEIKDNTPEFIVSSELLYQALDKLCAIPTESILYAVGNNYSNSFSIERIRELELDQSELGYAKANSTFSSKVLIDLEEYGTLLTCYFHAHPGKGIHSSHPSSTDIENQKRLERGNYNTIGGIFSRDGYLRFFTDKLQYNITILGKGVEHVSKDVYKLTEIS